jgi:hypothetical protein
MPSEPLESRRATEDRLDRLREEALRTGRVAAAGVAVAGGPMPRGTAASPGYYGQPIVKPPVWTWQIGLYFFVGGTAGMSGVIALAGDLTGQPLDFVRAALGVAFAGALISPLLLIWDLGRPTRFLNMLRVFKWRSAMSMGVWTLLVFGICSGSSFALAAGWQILITAGFPPAALSGVLATLVAATALSGGILGTYTGVLLGATVIPTWSAHHKLLPFHFGIVGLGAAASILELLGFRLAALNAIAFAVAAAETGVGIWLEAGRQGATARATPARTLLRTAALFTGPVPLCARLAGWPPLAAVCFLIGAVLSRYGWLLNGRPHH